ncbi:hypothetical protein KP509_29G053700 [Ceratopteris richardii]|uniref:Uncharacterized protein n=1 Tax=Ceratopteris richardii TaxID=49495 RepID=A0A8T2R818_CERRI|nr:hypothetical protein KP509_29G053700 [Ceratopteris richardii]
MLACLSASMGWEHTIALSNSDHQYVVMRALPPFLLMHSQQKRASPILPFFPCLWCVTSSANERKRKTKVTPSEFLQPCPPLFAMTEPAFPLPAVVCVHPKKCPALFSLIMSPERGRKAAAPRSHTSYNTCTPTNPKPRKLLPSPRECVPQMNPLLECSSRQTPLC